MAPLLVAYRLSPGRGVAEFTVTVETVWRHAGTLWFRGQASAGAWRGERSFWLPGVVELSGADGRPVPDPAAYLLALPCAHPAVPELAPAPPQGRRPAGRARRRRSG
ncbi:MAG TPA: hypothetical protein VEH84_03605 [Alphaproteobacteria bacterium]|nr:hypothetical protein [Alphaproteobacteria bacterium]